MANPRNPENNNLTNILLTIVALAVIVVGVLFYLNKPDNRSTGEKIGDAVEKLGDGTRDAGRELQDRTPGEKIGDAVKDAKEDIKDATKSE